MVNSEAKAEVVAKILTRHPAYLVGKVSMIMELNELVGKRKKHKCKESLYQPVSV